MDDRAGCGNESTQAALRDEPPRRNAAPTEALVAKYGGPGPRYTSYPAVPYWPAGYGAAAYRGTLAEMGQRMRGAGAEAGARDVSLYVHIPYCEHRCTFCACNVVISRDHRKGVPYVDLVTREMDLVLEATGGVRPRVVQMHWGGGTPTWLSEDELCLLHDRIAERFELAPEREQSIEVDPRVTTFAQISALRGRGLTRVSMGVQDFAPEVQAAIHREQTYELTAALVEHCRTVGIAGVNADLVYGLPHQSIAGFSRTIERVIGMGVDRVALYNFAYLPSRLAHHRAILPEWLPVAPVRIELFRMALRMFAEAGYRMIGLDHFARGDDELAKALDDGSIRRNFMGYTTRAGRDLLAFGASAISRIGRDFAQNAKETAEYELSLAAGALPIEKGMRLSDDDLRREALIQSVMCYGEADLAASSPAAALDLDGAMIPKLQALADDGLIELDGSVIRVTPPGRYFLRNIAMVFDAYLGAPPPLQEVRGRTVQVQFSRTV